MSGQSRIQSDTDWIESGNCHGIALAAHDLYDVSEAGQAEAAKIWCSNCPVKQECLNYAMKYNELWGVWGGTTEDERKLLRKSRKRK